MTKGELDKLVEREVREEYEKIDLPIEDLVPQMTKGELDKLVEREVCVYGFELDQLISFKSELLKMWKFHGGVIFASFSSPEPRARVTYCHSTPSVVRPSSVNFHIFDFFSRTARSAQGWIQGGAKIGHGGSSSSRNFFFRPEGYRDKPNA